MPRVTPGMPFPSRLMALRPVLPTVFDSLAEYTASADAGEGLLFDAADEHEVIIAFLRWLEVEVGRNSQRNERAGRPGRMKEPVA